MNSAKNQLIEQIEQLAAPVLQEHAAEMVDCEFVHEHGQWVLRFFLDKEKGITLDDCATISEHLGRILDATDLIPHNYSLEVSSPGLNRRLRGEKDYRKYLGERVDVTVFAPINGRRHFKGTIQVVDVDHVVIKDYAAQEFSLAYAGIAKANLDPEITV